LPWQGSLSFFFSLSDEWSPRDGKEPFTPPSNFFLGINTAPLDTEEGLNDVNTG